MNDRTDAHLRAVLIAIDDITPEPPPLPTSPSRQPARRQPLLIAAGAFVAALLIVGVGVLALRPDASGNGEVAATPSTQPSVISDDPYVVQAAAALPPGFELPKSAVEMPLQPITEFLSTDANRIRSLVSEADQIVAIGQIGESEHRVFWVTGTPSDVYPASEPHTTCIIDAAEHGSALCQLSPQGDVDLSFGVVVSTEAGSLELMGTVPESTAVVLVTTPRSSVWQIPRGGVAYVIVEGSLREAIGWQLFDAAGVLLDSRPSPGDNASDEEIAEISRTWVNQLGLAQTDVDVWRDRLSQACDEGVWDHDIARALAAEFIAADLSLSTRPEGSEPPSVGEGAQALWLMATTTCRDLFPASAIEAGPPQP